MFVHCGVLSVGVRKKLGLSSPFDIRFGNPLDLHAIALRHPDVPLWICVGDLASRTGEYPTPPRPLFWIKGNNEDFERIAAWEAGAAQPPNLHYIRNGTAADVGSLRVAGLGGHGMTTSAAVGELAAALLVGGPGQRSAPFAPERFDEELV